MRPAFTFAIAVFALLGLAVSPASTANAPAIPAHPYTWKNVQIVGGGFVTGILFNPTQRDLIYARTDVGGAYRWSQPEKRWLPLNGSLGARDTELQGVVSFATDPLDPRRLYLACGQYLPAWAKPAALFISSDYGQSWQRTPLPFNLGGNADGRSTGERLQVDPRQNSRLLLGTNQDGLWISHDFAQTWEKLSSCPARSITLVLFAPTESSAPATPTATIYVGINTTTGPSLLRSTDAGKTWAAVPGQPSGLFPHHAELAADGTLFLAYGNALGPNDVTDGAVWKLQPTAGDLWTNISPVQPHKLPNDRFGYGALSLDRQHPGTLMVATLDRWTFGDEIFRSTDSGSTWQPLLKHATWDSAAAPYVAPMKPHWFGDLDIDPFNSDRAFFVTGYGVWGTTDATQPTPSWSFAATLGIEETVPLSLVSPPIGAPLVSAIGDFDGFRHDDLDRPAPFAHTPRYGTNPSLEFAELAPEQFVRTHSGKTPASRSLDGARTWQDLPSFPPEATRFSPGKITVSADGQTFLWQPKNSTPYVSTDHGATWQISKGAYVSAKDYHTDTPVADRADPSAFYLCDQLTGRFYYSQDKGLTFTQSSTRFPIEAGILRATPGHAGHLWLPTSNGLFRSQDGGKSWTKIDGVSTAYQIGLGRPAEGKTYPALYLAGRVGAYDALFRSDDEGQSWTLINTARTRFGHINVIIGDPRIYGRVYLGTGGRGILYGEP